MVVNGDLRSERLRLRPCPISILSTHSIEGPTPWPELRVHPIYWYFSIFLNRKWVMIFPPRGWLDRDSFSEVDFMMLKWSEIVSVRLTQPFLFPILTHFLVLSSHQPFIGDIRRGLSSPSLSYKTYSWRSVYQFFLVSFRYHSIVSGSQSISDVLVVSSDYVGLLLLFTLN